MKTGDDLIDKGIRLERNVGRYFEVNGYDVSLNEQVVGRSGAVHEIDVLARRWDGVTTVSVAVECKARTKPIEKDVVSKLSMVIQDAGINKGIVATLGGWRSGAETVARELSIDLWGPDDLRDKLGGMLLGDLKGAHTVHTVLTLDGDLKPDDILKVTLHQHSRSILGTAREEVAWASLVYVPMHMAQIRYGVRVREFLRPSTTKMTPLRILYSALDNRTVSILTGQDTPAVTSRQPEAVVPAHTPARQIGSALLQAVDKYHAVTTEAAKTRWRERLETLGLPAVPTNISVESVTLVHHAVYAGLLVRKGRARWVAVDAVTGRVSDPESAAMTQDLSFVCTTLGVRAS